MGAYLDRIDRTAPTKRWPLVRQLMHDEAQPFLGELRAERPVLRLPQLHFVTRYADCALILHRFTDFGVDLYKPKQGEYFMAQDDTASHWREKSIMRAILDFEEVPAMRAFVAERTATILREAGGRIDLPRALTRIVPVALVQQFFGFGDGHSDELVEWSYWNQQDAFHNQPFDHDRVADPAAIVAKREASKAGLAKYLIAVVTARAQDLKAGGTAQDPISRLLRLSFSGGVKFPVEKVVANVAGLLIGAVETTSHTVNNALAELFSRPDVLARAKKAAALPDPVAFDGYVVEALRFRPAFPYFFRTCHRPTVLAGGTPFATRIKAGATVLACTKSAMLDEAAYEAPARFDRERTASQTFLFGYGEHECLGRVVANAMLTEIVRQCLRLPGLKVREPIEYRGGVPERHILSWRTGATARPADPIARGEPLATASL